MLNEWSSSPCFCSSHRVGGGRWCRGGSRSFPDSASACQVNPAGSMMGAATDPDGNSYPHFLCEETTAQSQGHHVSRLQGDRKQFTALKPGSPDSKSSRDQAGFGGCSKGGRWECGCVSGLSIACLPRSRGHTPPLHLASSHTEHNPSPPI